jgi:hypothetical protein
VAHEVGAELALALIPDCHELVRPADTMSGIYAEGEKTRSSPNRCCSPRFAMPLPMMWSLPSGRLYLHCEAEQGLGVDEDLLSGGCAGVLAVVGPLVVQP